MQSQIPAQGIMQTDEFHDAKVYKVSCSCGDNSHEHNVWVEIDKDINEVSVTLYTRVPSKHNIWRSLRQLLFNGYIEMETSILMNKQQALNYSDAIKNAVSDLEEKNTVTAKT
jgi:hypothetical protein